MDQFNAVCFVFEHFACSFKIYERERSYVIGIEKLTQDLENSFINEMFSTTGSPSKRYLRTARLTRLAEVVLKFLYILASATAARDFTNISCDFTVETLFANGCVYLRKMQNSIDNLQDNVYIIAKTAAVR